MIVEKIILIAIFYPAGLFMARIIFEDTEIDDKFPRMAALATLFWPVAGVVYFLYIIYILIRDIFTGSK